MHTAQQIIDNHMAYLLRGACDPKAGNGKKYTTREEIAEALQQGEIIEQLIVSAVDACGFGIMTQISVYLGIGFPPQSKADKKLRATMQSAMKTLKIN